MLVKKWITQYIKGKFFSPFSKTVPYWFWPYRFYDDHMFKLTWYMYQQFFKSLPSHQQCRLSCSWPCRLTGEWLHAFWMAWRTCNAFHACIPLCSSLCLFKIEFKWIFFAMYYMYLSLNWTNKRRNENKILRNLNIYIFTNIATIYITYSVQ